MARETKKQKAEREAAEAAAAANNDAGSETGTVANVGGETAVIESGENTNSGVDIDLLSRVVDATKGNSFLYLGTDESAGLVAAGLVETNASLVDNFGGVATRATAQGMQYMADNQNSAPAADAAASTAAPAAAASPSFVIASVPLPTRTRSNAGRSSQYPFDNLEVGQSFFVPASEKMPNPRKSLASTVSSATRRYATKTDQTRVMKIKGVEKTVPVYNETRKFEVFEGTGDAYGQPGVKGAIVGRTK